MKFLIAVLSFSILVFSQNGWATVCITETRLTQSADAGDVLPASVYDSVMVAGLFDYSPASLQCKQLNRVQIGLSAAALALQGGAIGAACTVAGAPIAVQLEIASLAAGSLALVVSSLPCSADDDEQKIKAVVDQAVCTALAKQGIQCDL